MAKTQNLFIAGKSDSDTSYPLLDNKSFVYAENLRISGEGNDGTFKSLKGSKLVSDGFSQEKGVVIREFEGENNKLFYCIAHKNKLSSIVEYDIETEVSRLIIEDSQYLRFDMLRWDEIGQLKNAPFEYLLSFNQIGDFLIFSSQYWQYPRMVNLTRTADYAAGFLEEDIVLIKKPPLLPPAIFDKILDPTIVDKELCNKFISISYRYKYVDGDFSSLSTYSDTLFWQKSDDFDIDSKRKNLGMENAYNKVKLRVNSGGKYVTNVEVYAREHGSNVAYLIYNLNKKSENVSDDSNVDVDYSFSKKYEVLDKDSTNLLYNNSPLFPYTQDSVGNRMTYANYVEGFDLIDKLGNNVNVDYEVFNNQKDFSETDQNRTAVSLFSYKVCPVFLNDYNIATTCLLPTIQSKSEVDISFSERLKVNQLQVKFDPNFKPPAFATKLKFAVKAEKLNYEILYMTYAKKIGQYIYFQLSADNINRLKKDDIIIKVDDSVGDYNEFVVEEVEVMGVKEGLAISGVYGKVKDQNNLIDLTSNGTTIRRTYKEPNRPIIDAVYGSTDSRRYDATSGYAGNFSGAYYESAANKAFIVKSDISNIKEGDLLTLKFSFEYGRQKNGRGAGGYGVLGTVVIDEELYASDDYINILEFVTKEIKNPYFKINDAGSRVEFLTNNLFPDNVRNSAPEAAAWQPNGGDSGWGVGGRDEYMVVTVTTEMNLERGIKPLIFRTKQIALEEDGNDEGAIYYETDKVYKILDGTIIPDALDGNKMVFDINFYNGYSWGNGIESYKIRDEFNGKALNYNFRPNQYDINGYKAVRKANDITYSGLYNYELKLNQLSIFNAGLLNWKTLPSKYGAIKRILSSDNNISIYCINKVMLLLYEKSVLLDLTGNESVATSNEVFGSNIVIDYECGVGNNPESVVSLGNAHIFADPIRKRLYVKQGRNIQELNALGAQVTQGSGCFYEFVKLLSDHKTFLGCYDDARGEYILGIDQEFSVAYAVTRGGISGYFRNKFDYLHSMSGKSFTAFQGKIYQNEVTDQQNMFAGQGPFAAKIKAVVNPEISEDKVFKAWYLQSNTGWDTEIRTNLTSTTIPVAAYVQKESYFHTEIFRDNNSPLGIKGVGNINYKDGNILKFNYQIENSIAINDTLQDEAGNKSKIVGIDKSTITVEDASLFTVAEYVFASKVEENGYRPDGVPMRGQWMEFTLSKVPDKEIFITSVYTEVIESKL